MPDDNTKAQMEQASNEGWSALERGDWDAAEKAYDDAIKTARGLGDKLAEALFRSYRGEARRGQGRTDDARADIEHSLAVAQSEGCAQIIAHSQFLLSELDTDAGDVSKAIDRLVKSLDAALACGDGMTAEVAFGKLGLLYLDLGWLEPASECFRQALEQTDEESPNRAAWLGNLGQSLAEMGQIEESIGFYRQALEHAQATGDTVAQAKCFASEGLSHFQQERYDESVECFKQALTLANGGNLQAKSVWMGNLGNVFLRLGQTDKAAEFASEGLKIAKGLNDRHSEAAHLDTLGDCLSSNGEHEEALKHYRSALEIGQSIADKIGERIYLSNVARAHKRLGDMDTAIDCFRDAIKIFDEQRSRINADSLKTSFAATGQSLYRDTIHACLEAGRRVEALEYVGRAKSRAILDLLRNSPIDISELQEVKDESVAKLVAREQELSRQIARLERIYWQGPMDSDPTGHRGGGTVTADDAPRLYNEWREVVDQLKRRHRNYATMVAVDTLSFAELGALWGGERSSLPRETAIIEFFLSDEFLFTAAVWSGCEQPAIEVTLDSKELAGLLNDVADFLEMSSTEGWEVPVSLCKRLYQRLMSTVCGALPDYIERLILVPHGVLHRVPFAAMHDGHGYLIERYSMSYLPTSSLIPVLSGAAPDEAENLRYLISAISDYSATRNDGIVFSSRLRSAAGLEDLSYVLEEGKTVYNLAAQHVTEARLLTNDEVKDGLLSMFSDYPVVHFAGHAVFNPDEPLASGLVLADGSILTAARILQDNALRTKCGKLLVLSACQTGVNVITNGGEILGLARALMYAGMPNLILSLWEVADRSTAELMQHFHDAWQGGKVTIATALAEAQRTACRENQPIHAWAPFIHLGIE